MPEIHPLKASDLPAIFGLLDSRQVFLPHELSVAKEVFTASLNPISGYETFTAWDQGKIIGVICFGKNPMTDNLYDLYWIVVASSHQRRGIGKMLIRFLQEEVRKRKGRKIVIETSSLPRYEPARKLYEKVGFSLETMLKDFYAPSDHKLFYTWSP